MTEVSSSRQNILVERITRVLGNGEGTFGYGQGFGYGASPSSFEVSNSVTSNNNIVTAESINALYSDMVRARLHQIGSEPDEIAEIIANANVIAETESFIVDNRGITVVDENGDRKGILDFENLMQSIENDRFLLARSQAAVELVLNSTRTSPWNSILTHEFEVEFSSYNHRRHFFNSGGEIRISAEINSTNTDKGQSWSQFVNSFGSVLFNHNSTQSDTTFIGINKGNYQLNNSYQTIFIATDSEFTDKEYKIEAKVLDYVSPAVPGKVLRFRITLNDKEVNNQIYDIVDGTIKSNIEIFKADSDAVRVNTPQLFNVVPLTSADTPEPPPTYSIDVDNDVISEGSSGTYTVSTTNVPNGTVLYWTISNITTSSADFNSNSGLFTINNNTGTFSIIAIADQLTEGNESFTVNIRTGSTSGNIVASTSTTIDDTSTTPPPTYTLSPTSQSVNEGSTATFDVDTTNLPNNTTLYWTINGTTSDFSSTSGSFIVNNNTGSFSISAIADELTEGDESYTVSLRTGSASGTVVDTSTLTVNDTGTTPAPTYSLFPTSTSVDEGSTATFDASTTNLSNNTTLYWTINGTTSDFSSTSGSFTVNNNSGSFSISAQADQTTEGNESYTVFLRTGSTSGTVVDTSTLTVNDTGTTPLPTYSLTPEFTSIAVGGTPITYSVSTTNVPDGTILTYRVRDLSDPGGSTGTVTINNNSGSFTVSTSGLTEGGNEVRLSSDGTTVDTATFVIECVEPDSVRTDVEGYRYTYVPEGTLVYGDGSVDSSSTERVTSTGDGPTNVVFSWYGLYLGREPDRDGFDFWVRELLASDSFLNARTAFNESAEEEKAKGGASWLSKCEFQNL